MIPPPVPPDTSAEAQLERDKEHLRLLAIFHFVGAGLALLGIGFLCLHFFFMRLFFTHPAFTKGGKDAPPEEMLKFFVLIYIMLGALFILCGLCNLLSGLFLRQRKHRTFSLAIAAFNCLHMPIGTTLGVFTIIVLERASVRELYGKS